MTDHNLNSLCRVCRGRKPAPGHANTYFVMKGGECVLATTIFNVANNLFDSWVQCQIKESCVLADRRSGDVATYYPTKGLTVDLRNEIYYQAVKYGISEQLVRDHQDVVAKKEHDKKEHVKRIGVLNQWLRWTGAEIDSFFYVQENHGSHLVGCQVHYNKASRQIVRVGRIELSFDGDVFEWFPAVPSKVRELKLNSYLSPREVFPVDVAGQWLVKHGKKSDTYFYVQHVQRNGKLRGFVMYFDHNARYEGTAMGQFIEKADIHDWKVAYIETVRALKLDKYL